MPIATVENADCEKRAPTQVAADLRSDHLGAELFEPALPERRT